MSVKNFVQCGLVTPVAANTVELVLAAPTASYQYPPLDGGTLVIADSVARPTFYEIISYTHRIDNVLYGVVRAKEGTTARAWTGATWIYQALTAQDYVDALALKAPLASPALTGVPTAPTAPLGTNTQQIATMAAVQAAIANLIASSPAALDTLNELAAALGNDPNFATTVNNALAGKEPSIAAGTSAQMWLGNKTWASVLTQVQNTLLTGLGAGSNASILTTDTLIGALAKIQNQLNNKVASSDSRLTNAREWTAVEVTQAEAEAGSATTVCKWSPLRVWQAVLASKLTGINLTLGTEVSATDTVLIALGKLQKQITDAATNLAGNVRATVLTGYVTGSNAILASTDTVLAAFGKLQAQITGLASSKLDATANAVSASKLANTRTISVSGAAEGSVNFDGSSNVEVVTKTPKVNPATDPTSTFRADVFGAVDDKIKVVRAYDSDFLNFPQHSPCLAWSTEDTHAFFSPSYGSPRIRVGAGAGAGIAWQKDLAFTDSDITGNAASATKLQTPRTINDVAFDGSTNITVADSTKLPLAGGTLTGPLTSPKIHLNRSSALASGISWYSAGYTAWQDYMAAAGIAGQGVNGNVTAPAGTLVTSWARRSFIENVAGYGWTFESGSSTSTAPTVVAEIQSSDGSAKFAGSVTAAQFNGSGAGLTNLNASNLGSGTIPDARLSGTYTGVNITGNAATATTLSGLTASVAELNYVGGVTSNIQTQLNGKAASGHSHSNYYTHDGVNTGWFRSTGTQGWYSETYGGGICMTDSTYVRTYNNKQFLCNNVMRVEGASPQVQLWDTDHGILRYLYADGGSIGFLTSAGGWALMNDNAGNTTSTGNVTAYSDIRLKKDIELIPDALDKVLALRGVTYERIDSGERQTGVIAQEVQAVLPEAVMEGNDEDKTLSVAYGNLVGLLIESIKELNQTVTELRTEVNTLKGNV